LDRETALEQAKAVARAAQGQQEWAGPPRLQILSRCPAWLADILVRLPDHPAKRIHELLSWNWPQRTCEAAW